MSLPSASPTLKSILHIVFSESYSVPVLYFEAMNAASGMAVTLDEFRSSLQTERKETSVAITPLSSLTTAASSAPEAPVSSSPSSTSSMPMVPEQALAFVSQQFHPSLNRPFFFLHPCNTASFMEIILSSHIPSSSPSTLQSPPSLYLTAFINLIAKVLQGPSILDSTKQR